MLERGRYPAAWQAPRPRRLSTAPALHRRRKSGDRARCCTRRVVAELVARATRTREVVARVQLRSSGIRLERRGTDAADRRPHRGRIADAARSWRRAAAVPARRPLLWWSRRTDLRAAVSQRDGRHGARRPGTRGGLG